MPQLKPHPPRAPRLRPPWPPARARQATRGMSLIELLVALVIASLGLLTLVALQAASLRYTRVSERRAVGSLLADDLMERVRANATSASDLPAYVYGASFGAQGTQSPAAPPTRCDQPAVVCSAAEMAAFDLYQWRLSARALLPEGAVLTALTPDPSQAGQSWLDLWVAWRDPALPQAAGVTVRPAGECPTALGLDSVRDPTVRCMRWRLRR